MNGTGISDLLLWGEEGGGCFNAVAWLWVEGGLAVKSTERVPELESTCSSSVFIIFLRLAMAQSRVQKHKSKEAVSPENC